MENRENSDIRILVVDDNEVNVLVMVNMLKIFGILADQTNRGSNAVDLSRKVSYDLIFIDHLMPEMDGIQTTKQIRLFSCNQRSVIITLTSRITEQLSELYMQAGADDIYEKPLDLQDMVSLLNKWIPKLNCNACLTKHNANICYKNSELIQSIIETIDDIDYQKGLKFAAQNPNLYIHTLEASLKDLQSCRNIIVNSNDKNSTEELRRGIHKLFNVYSSIGAAGLSEESALFEKELLCEETIYHNNEYNNCLQNLMKFFEKLQAAIDRYHVANPVQQKTDFVCMTSTEYEQCLMKTIYYIRRYEYDAIIRELEHLISRARPEDKYELEQAIGDAMNYEYDKALTRLLRLKNKTGDLPVLEYEN